MAKMKREKIEKATTTVYSWEALLEVAEDRSQPVISRREAWKEAEYGVRNILGLRKRMWIDPFRRTNSECSSSARYLDGVEALTGMAASPITYEAGSGLGQKRQIELKTSTEMMEVPPRHVTLHSDQCRDPRGDGETMA